MSRCCSACLFALIIWGTSSCGRTKTRVSEVKASGGVSQERMVDGFYPGTAEWLWTAPKFVLLLDPAKDALPSYLEIEFNVPDELISSSPVVTVTAKVNGTEVARQSYNKAGRNVISVEVPGGPLKRKPAEVEFVTDHSFSENGKQKALIFLAAGLKNFTQSVAFQNAEAQRAQVAYKEVLQQRDLKFPIEQQKQLMRLFHELPIWETLSFHGVRIIKNPLDLWMLQQIAWEVKPEFVVETGTWQGGSALWWAQTLDGMELEDSRVLTVDIQDLTTFAAKQKLWKKYITFSLGSSTDPKIVAAFAEKVKGKRVIVNLDSDHSMAHVLQELRMYAPMVSKGSYIAVEDTHLDGVPTHPEQGPGPLAAVLQFMKEGGNKDFEQDFSRESMVMTSYPGGWLRRK